MGVGLIGSIGLVLATLNSFYKAALYTFATTCEIPSLFPLDLMRSAIRKGRPNDEVGASIKKPEGGLPSPSLRFVFAELRVALQLEVYYRNAGAGGLLLLEGVGQLGKLRSVGGGIVRAEVKNNVLRCHGASAPAGRAHQSVVGRDEVEQPTVCRLLFDAGGGDVVENCLGIQSPGRSYNDQLVIVA